MPAVRILPVTQQAPDEGACCGACAAEALAVSTRPARPTISRTDDRRITFAGLASAVAILGIAVASLALPEPARRGLWLPLHLGLAGAAGTAIAAVLPFFTAALTVAPPARPRVRLAAVVLVALGALVVSVGVVRGVGPLAVAGGLLYLAGLGALAAAAFAPLRGSLGPRRRLVESAYAAALAQVGLGVVLATAFLAGVTPIADRWALLRPAHGWLNVFGFLSIVVAATLLHLAPTVAGSRIRARRSATVAVSCLVVGAPVIAFGLATASDLAARFGAAIELVGAAALVAHGIGVRRDRGSWTTDAAWHRVAEWSLTIAPAWFLVAVGIAAGRVLLDGATAATWNLGLVAPPLAVGWLVQVLVASWTHIVPAIGPGDFAVHARQRAILGRLATARVVALNLGVALATVGLAAGMGLLAAVGGGFILFALLAAFATFAIAMAVGRPLGRRDPDGYAVAPSGGG